jgi:hypothetical protein
MMALCTDCGKPLFPSGDYDTCRLCRENIAGFEPGRIIYRKDKSERKVA